MTSRSSPAGAWHGRGNDRYVTRRGELVGEAVRTDAGWFAKVARWSRGPLSSLDAAMHATDDMLADITRTSGNTGNGREPSARD